MVLTFDFDLEDWLALQENYLKNSPAIKLIQSIISFLLPLVLFALLFKYSKNYPTNTMMIAGCVMLIFSIIWVFIIQKTFLKTTLVLTKKLLSSNDNSSLIGIHQLQFTDEGIEISEPGSEQKIPWNAYKKLTETEQHYFLYNTSVSATVIPKQKIDVPLHELDKMLHSKFKR